jgi:hypothetical protein
MVATVTDVAFMTNDWRSELDRTLDIINLPDATGTATDLNILVQVAGSPAPPSLRVSVDTYEPGSRVIGKGSVLHYRDVDLARARPEDLPFRLPAGVTAYRGSVTDLDGFMRDADGVREFATVARTGGTSDAFFRPPLARGGWVSRGVGRQPDKPVLDLGNEHRQEPSSLRLFQAGGVEVVEVAVQPHNGLVLKKGKNWGFLRSAADVFYYTGHGAFWNGDLILPGHQDWLSPEMLLASWRCQKGSTKGPWDLDALILGGCSVLYIDFDNAKNPYSHGRQWAELLMTRGGPLAVLLGYGAGKEAPPSPRGGKAPVDNDGKGHQLGNVIAQHMAQAMAGGLEYRDYVSKWLEVNRTAGIYTAVGIDAWSGYRDALAPDKPRKL